MSTERYDTQSALRPGQVLNLGLVGYEEALVLQRRLRDQRIAGEIPDTLLLLEHPPIITIGRSGNMENVRVSESVLVDMDVELYHTDRGGDVTYHGPGQLVGYTIMDLKPYGLDIRRHLWRIEEVIITALKTFGIAGTRAPGYTGVWVEDQKIASIGLHIKRWVTMHGFALNLDTQLEHFGLIYPCGIRDKSITSVARLLGHPIQSSRARGELARAFGRVFGLVVEERRLTEGVRARQ